MVYPANIDPQKDTSRHCNAWCSMVIPQENMLQPKMPTLQLHERCLDDLAEYLGLETVDGAHGAREVSSNH